MGSRAQQWVGGPWDKALVPSDSNSSVSCLPLHCDLWLGIKALLMEFCHVSVPYKGRCPPGATGGWHQGMRHFKRRVPKVGTEAHSPTQGSQHLYFLLNLWPTPAQTYLPSSLACCFSQTRLWFYLLGGAGQNILSWQDASFWREFKRCCPCCLEYRACEVDIVETQALSRGYYP